MTDENNDDANSKSYEGSAFFKLLVYIVFIWVMVGITGITGKRLYHNAPLHPSFLPFAGAALSAALSFAIVTSLQYVSGEITLKLGENREFSGASGPIVLWCLCFIVICFGLYFLGFSEALSLTDVEVDNCPVHKLRDCLP